MISFDGYTTFIPFQLLECHICSAVVLHHKQSIENHRKWHEAMNNLLVDFSERIGKYRDS